MMYRWSTGFILLLSVSLLSFSPPVRVVEWLTPTTYDFGIIEHHQPVDYTFQFRNISDQPITIDNVRPSCGCTAPNWDVAPIPPDSIGQIHINYDARNKGEFRKKITVFFSGQRKGDKLFVEGETLH